MSPSSQTAAPRVPVCGIGASAGGVEALQQLFTSLPNDLGMAYVVIVHLAPDHKSELPAIIGRTTSMPVTQVGDHDKFKIAPNHVYVIAPDRQLVMTDSSVSAQRFDQPRGQRTAIDSFFRSLAVAHGDGFAVLLSGSGSDGAVGAKAIKECGGLVLVQDPREAQHSGIPRAAISSGVADLVLPVRELGMHLAELARFKEVPNKLVHPEENGEPSPVEEENALKSVLDTLRKRTGHDFSKYKRSTILRRLSRRMQLAHQHTIAGYLRHLRANASEVQALFNDLLISVTTFFRDPDVWAALEGHVIEPLVDRASDAEPIRAWVAGCSTGEEAYTVAMLLHEAFARRKLVPHFTVFASDADESAIAVAREGIYPRAISADVSDSRLERYFRPDDDHYRVVPDLRDHIVFAVHNMLRDPPFARLDLVSCRNVLIYLDPELQQQMMNVFRYAARDGAFLLLGASESADEALFEPIDKKHRIFAMRSRGDGKRPVLPDILVAPGARQRGTRDPQLPPASPSAVHVAALEELAPPSVLIDERWNVLHMSSSVSRFFQQEGGTLARRLPDLVRPELRDEMHTLLHHVQEQPTLKLSRFVPVRFNGTPHNVAVLAQQRSQGDGGRTEILVTFLDAGEIDSSAATGEGEGSGVVQSLRAELRRTEQHMETIRDDHDFTTEELRAANEDLQSLNEEYRSTTEELETSKEELQSLNEELNTINYELKIKLEEVSTSSSDLENLIAATDVAIVFLSADLRIKRFTPTVADIFKVKSRDIDRPIADLKHTLDYDVEEDARHVLATAASIERKAVSESGRSYAVRLNPYRASKGQTIDGVVVTFIDVTDIKHAESALIQSRKQLEGELGVMRRLHATTLSVTTAATMHDALHHLLSAAIDLHGADFGCIQLLDASSRRLHMVAHHGFARSFLQGLGHVGENDDSASGRALRGREIVQIRDVGSDPRYAPFRTAAAQGGYRAVQSTPLVARDGTMLGVLSVHFRDIHPFTERDNQVADLLARQAADLIERRAQQESLQQLNETLRRRSAELEASQEQLSRQAADLQEQDRHREEFLAALGHELRNPMAAIQSSVMLLSAPDERSGRALAVLKRQMQHMTRLVNDLLDVTRVRHGRLRLQRQATDINAIVCGALENVRERAEKRGLNVDCEASAKPLYVDADAERVAQILDNLLRNAIAYTDAGQVHVSVRKEHAFARVTVRDTGIGITPEDIPALFQPYRRGGDGQRGEGLGLGLALSKALVEAHGGALSCHSEGLGKGSEFTFAIPLARSVPSSAPVGVEATPARRRVLVVDDERDVADMFAALLATLGQDVRVAYDGEAALALAREHQPQVAFIDVSMPRMSGAELAKRLRDALPPPALTLVAVSGHDKSHRSVREGDFDHHVLKPVTGETLTALLNSLT